MRLCVNKFPLLFEGGVVVKDDYQAFAILTSQPGWLVLLVSSYLYWREKPKNL
jgi:hypothetical protein